MKVLIIGGVAGGAGTAARLRRNDENCEIIIFEKDEFISFANCGLPYYIGGKITEKSDLILQTPESFASRFNVDVRVFNQVLSIDISAKELTAKNLITNTTYTESYDKLVLSPGAVPVKPNIKGADNPNVFTLRNIPDTLKIKKFIDTYKPKSCTIIGAGFIGLEMAENAAMQNMKVTIVEAAPHVMAPIDMDMAHDVHNYVRSKGMKLHLNSICREIEKDKVILDNGGEIESDMIILSIGVRPATDFLETSGIQLGGRGEILVNSYLETSAQDVYALGDAISTNNIVTNTLGIIPLASPANRQARIVADNIVGMGKEYSGSQGTSIVKVFDMTVAVTGKKEADLLKDNIPYHKAITQAASNATYYPGSTPTFLKLLFSPSGDRVLGGQIVGFKGVDKRIDCISNAIRFGLDINGLQEMELAYAPPFSSAKDPVNMLGYVGENIASGRMPQFFIEDIGNLPPDAILLDVRTKEEFLEGSIPSFINIPLDELRNRLNEVEFGKPIYITCQTGLRGYIAQQILIHKGEKAFNLAGGYRLYEARMIDITERN